MTRWIGGPISTPLPRLRRGTQLDKRLLAGTVAQAESVRNAGVSLFSAGLVDTVVRQFRVLNDYADVLRCYRWNGEDRDTKEIVVVAKPWLLRRTPFDGQTIAGKSYVYQTNSTRTVDGVTQTVTPPYQTPSGDYEGDIIWAAIGIEDGLTESYAKDDETEEVARWLDLNADGRHWAAGGGGSAVIYGKQDTSGTTWTLDAWNTLSLTPCDRAGTGTGSAFTAYVWVDKGHRPQKAAVTVFGCVLDNNNDYIAVVYPTRIFYRS